MFLRAEGLGSFTSMRVNGMYQRAQIVEKRLAMLEVQDGWLAMQPSVDVSLVSELIRRREGLERQLAKPLATVVAARESMANYETVIGERRSRANQVREKLQAMNDELDTARTRLALQSEGRGVQDPAVVAVADELKRRIEEHRGQLATLESDIVSLPVPHDIDDVPTALFDTIERSIEELARGHFLAWPREEAEQMMLARVETTHGVLHNGYVELGEVLDSIERAAESELGQLREQFESEVSAVGDQRDKHTGSLAAARTLSLQLTRDGFGRLEAFFAGSMRKADMGIVDVHWARKLERSDEIDEIKAHQETAAVELKRRFELIRAKLGDAP